MDAISRFALSALVNLAWQVVCIALAASACTFLFRKSPSKQYRIWLVAFTLCCFAPLTSLSHYRSTASAAPIVRPDWVNSALPVHRPAPFSPDSRAGEVMLAAYLIYVLCGLARLVVSWRRARNEAEEASPVELPDAAASAIADLQVRIGVALPEVRLSATPSAPFTFGIRRPVIVVPEQLLNEDSRDLLQSVVAHEMAHIQRRDFLWNALLESLFPFLAFHPCAHWIRARIRAARELSCDAIIAATVLDGARYAESLLNIALKTAALVPATSPGLCSVTSNDLEDRIRHLVLKRNAAEPRFAWRIGLSAVLLAGVVGVGVAYSFQPSDPRDYAGMWRENWASALRPGLDVDRNDCCFRTLEIGYQEGRFQGTLTSDFVNVSGNRVTRAGRTMKPIREPALENGILRFRQTGGVLDEIYEVTLSPDGSVLVRSHDVQPMMHNWTVYPRLH
jgi:beta-lactamase regulating signal transducer with metallopeptidase domain